MDMRQKMKYGQEDKNGFELDVSANGSEGKIIRAECAHNPRRMLSPFNCMYFQAQARRSSGGLRGRGKHPARVQSLGGSQGKRFSSTHAATIEFSMRVRNVSSRET
jgi:hypothetical protein